MGKADKHYLGEYTYAGAKWGCEVWADDMEDAQKKLRAMSHGEIVGECMAVIPVPTFMQRLFALLIGKSK